VSECCVAYMRLFLFTLAEQQHRVADRVCFFTNDFHVLVTMGDIIVECVQIGKRRRPKNKKATHDAAL
jgi:hypothetical protein